MIPRAVTPLHEIPPATTYSYNSAQGGTSREPGEAKGRNCRDVGKNFPTWKECMHEEIDLLGCTSNNSATRGDESRDESRDESLDESRDEARDERGDELIRT